MMQPRPIAFVIMPFGGEFDAVFAKTIVPALPDYDTIRADTELDHRSILEKIITGLEKAALVIADLSALRPNVMYELGIAHTLGKPTVMIAQQLSTVPFDVSTYPVLPYSADNLHADEFAERLREIGERHLRKGVPFASPVHDFLTSSGRQRRREIEPLLRPDYGTGDFLADMDLYTPQVRDHLLRFRELMEGASGGVAELVSRLAEVTEARSPDIVKALELSAKATANELQFFADAVETQVVPGFHRSWTHLGQAMLWFSSPDRLRTMSRTDFDAGRDVTAFIDERVGVAIENVTTLRNALSGVRGLTRELTAAARATEHALDLYLSEMVFAREYIERLKERLGLSR